MKILVSIFILFVAFAQVYRQGVQRIPSGPLVQLATNSHYFATPTGQAIFLAGSHSWNDSDGLGTGGSPVSIDFNRFAEFLNQHGLNTTILWRKDVPVECNWNGNTWTMTPQPFPRSATTGASDGGNKFDLSQTNSAFFNILRSNAVALNNRGIYAIVELFDTANSSFARCGTTSPNGDGGPFTGVNNINSIDDGYTSGICGVGAFTMTAANAITDAQDMIMRKFVDTLNDLPNIIWEVAEEQPGTSFSSGCPGYGGASSMTFWAPHIATVVRNYEKTKPYQHLVGIGSMNANDCSGGDTTLYGSGMDWIAPSLSCNFSNQCASNACVVSTNNQGKLVLNDSDHSAAASTLLNTGGSVNTANTHLWVWANLMNGASGLLFMDPYLVFWTSGTPTPRNSCGTVTNGICTGALDSKYEDLRLQMGYAANYANKRMDLGKATPIPSISSTGWCLGQNIASGSEFLVYSPNNSAFTMNLSVQNGKVLNVEWFDATKGSINSTTTYTATSSTAQTFTPPGGITGDAVLYLVDQAGHN